MQAIDSIMLLSRETLPRDQMSCSILFQYQTQNKTATVAAAATTSTTAQVKCLIS